ncbi:CDP-alcohol phosphatidyltransferase family protein [Georgenia sp. Z1344]|uniref:CDP-alcohol phosphatidyltransferase family protein n=1 Tax=Georgenia sp. Z1344 TaxID=3416706 RepID=UPI003CF85830
MPTDPTTDGRLRRASGRPDWATIPNLVTLLRFLLLGPACWVIVDDPEGSWWPPVLVGVWAVTDWVDGLLARALNQQSRTGEILDPVADRIGIALVVVALGVADALSWVPVAVIVLVDLIVVALAGRAAQQGRMRVTYVGKARTAVLFFGICGIVLGISVWPEAMTVGRVLVWVGAALHIYSATLYIRAARLGTGPAVRRPGGVEDQA